MNNRGNSSDLSKDREDFIKIIDETVIGAGPEDFKEYDYDDISSDR